MEGHAGRRRRRRLRLPPRRPGRIAPAAPAPAAPAGRPGTPAELEQRLADMHFDVGAVDGVYDEATNHAAMALQKTYDLPRTGVVDEALILKVAESPGPPGPIVPDGEPHRVEIDLNRQTLYLYEGGSLTKILSASTGNGERFCSGGCRNAVTPTGAFRAYRQGHGWETGPLGSLYNPLYFNGGIADPRVDVGARRARLPRLRAHPDELGRMVPRPRGRGHGRPRGWVTFP